MGQVSLLSNKISWFGKHSGYECIDQFFPDAIRSKVFYTNKNTLLTKLKGRLYQYFYKKRGVKASNLAIGVEFLNTVKTADSIGHILYSESQLHLLEIASDKVLNNLVGTIHLPIKQWDKNKLSKLAQLKNAIILYESEISEFQKYLNNTNIKFIRHGINNSFFKPGTEPRNKTTLLCVGHYLRNFEMLERVINFLEAKKYELNYQLVIPAMFRNTEVLIRLAKKSNITFYEKLTDEELLALYQECGMTVIPMNDSGANTAIIQAIACGTPVVTTNVGGIRSYGGGDIFPLVDNNDDLGMAELIIKYVDDDIYASEMSNALRKFSLDHLDWYDIARQHANFYNSLK